MASPLMFSLLRHLADGEFHSGEKLARALGVSRTLVWQSLRGIERLGLTLHRIRGRGYQLRHPISFLDVGAIQRLLPRECSLQLELVDETTSTNTMLLQRAAHDDMDRRVLAAELQTAGRGRLGRSWVASLGGSLTFSLGWRFAQGAAFLAGLSLAVGAALVRGFHACSIHDVKLKWPNDLVVGERKIGGILIEVLGDALGPSTVVIGVGINVRLSALAKAAIDQPTIDLSQVTADLIDRNQLFASLLASLIPALEQYARYGFANFADEWRQHHAYHGRSVLLRAPDGETVRGKVTGVDGNGALVLSTRRGPRRFLSGELSLRGA